MKKANIIRKVLGDKVEQFISSWVDIEKDEVELMKTINRFNIETIEEYAVSDIVNINKINDIRNINSFCKAVNEKLPLGGYFIGCAETKNQRKKRLLRKYPIIIAQLYFLSDFIFKRVFPKLKLTRWLYFFVTAGRNQVFSRAEILGRMVYCGFKIEKEVQIDNMLYFVMSKKREPIDEKEPSYGLLFRMKRIGKHGNQINVYKFRTMHPYAEFLQDYVYQRNKLQAGGKFRNDFRITPWGRLMRKMWIDELPMIINILKGEIKLVGVRPLSQHYLSLYDQDLKEQRKKVKPGLVPPFYVDLPETLHEIMDSEKKYLESYDKEPLETDMKYFFRATGNILFKRIRSN